MPDRHLADLPVKRLRRVEGSGRALGDIGDAAAAQAPPLAARERADVGAGVADLAADDGAARPRISEGGEADRRLAGAAFADEAQHLAAVQGEVMPWTRIFSSPSSVRAA